VAWAGARSEGKREQRGSADLPEKTSSSPLPCGTVTCPATVLAVPSGKFTLRGWAPARRNANRMGRIMVKLREAQRRPACCRLRLPPPPPPLCSLFPTTPRLHHSFFALRRQAPRSAAGLPRAQRMRDEVQKQARGPMMQSHFHSTRCILFLSPRQVHTASGWRTHPPISQLFAFVLALVAAALEKSRPGSSALGNGSWSSFTRL